jgi:hypothetical protein
MYQLALNLILVLLFAKHTRCTPFAGVVCCKLALEIVLCQIFVFSGVGKVGGAEIFTNGIKICSLYQIGGSRFSVGERAIRSLHLFECMKKQ